MGQRESVTVVSFGFLSQFGGELGSTGLLRCLVACRGWSAGLVKSRLKLICREFNLSPSRCLNSSHGIAASLLPLETPGDANAGSSEPNHPLRLRLNS